MTLKERIKGLCKENGISMNQLEKELGFAAGYISKLGKSAPNSTYIGKIADYFNVSIDYLTKGKEDLNDAPIFKKQHMELINLYESLSEEQQVAVINLMKTMNM